MKSTDPAPARSFDRNVFLILLVVVTVALAAIIWPFYGAVFWGAVLALLFEPLYRKLAAPQRRVHFAHADLSAYSVFEEAFFHGMRAGRAAAVA